MIKGPAVLARRPAGSAHGSAGTLLAVWFACADAPADRQPTLAQVAASISFHPTDCVASRHLSPVGAPVCSEVPKAHAGKPGAPEAAAGTATGPRGATNALVIM